MKKTWEYSVTVDATAEQVWPLIADFNRHGEWDKFARKFELTKSGDANGVGAEWKVYELLGLLSLGEDRAEPRHANGLAKRIVREVNRNQRMMWHTHPVPNIGISADVSLELQAEGSMTRLTQKVEVNVPGVVEKVGRIIFKNLDERQQAQWRAGLERLKAVAEGAEVREAVAV